MRTPRGGCEFVPCVAFAFKAMLNKSLLPPVTVMSEQDLRTLESQVEQLIQYCQRLELENRRLHRSETQLKEERNRLQQLHNDTRKRVDAMITRLKSLEQEA